MITPPPTTPAPGAIPGGDHRSPTPADGAKPRLHVLLSDYTADPARGGSAFWYHAIAALRGAFSVAVLTVAELGLAGNGRITPAKLADAVYPRIAADPAPLLQDTVFWRGARAMNRRLRDGLGTEVISFGQEDYIWRRRTWFDRLRRRMKFAAYLRSCSAHIVVSGSMRDHYRAIGVRDAPIAVVYPGTALAGIAMTPRPARAPAQPIRVVTAGVYTQAKGQDLLVEALGLIKRRHPRAFARLQVDCFGNRDFDRRFTATLDARVATLGIGATIRLNAGIPQAELWRRFADSDIFSFVANGEGFALVTIEAMAQGCIPILGREGSASEALGGSGCGTLVDRDPHQLMNALLALIRQEERFPAIADLCTQQAKLINRTWSQAAAHLADQVTAMARPRPPRD